jgi:hypothetical protein
MKTIKSIFMDGMDLAAKNSEYCDNLDEELSRIGIDVGDDMDDIINHFHELNKELEDKMYREKADEIFKCIPMKMEVFYDKFANECMDKPIFNHYDAYQMFQRITCASNEDIVLIKEMLVDRAKKYKDELEPELGFIKKLKQVLEDYCKGKDVTIKNVMLKEFANDLNSIIDLYKNSIFSAFQTKETKEFNLDDIDNL